MSRRGPSCAGERAARALTQERAQRTLRRLQAGRTAAASRRPGERPPSCVHPRGLLGHGKPSTAARSAAHSPASKRPFDLQRSGATCAGVWGHVVPTRSAGLRSRRVRHARAPPVPGTLKVCDRSPLAPRPAWHARHPSLAVRTPWPSCWCRPRGQALTQKPGGITFQTHARREDRQRKTRGRSGTAADLQERSAIRVAPERGVRGGRHPRHGQSAAAPVPSLLSPLGGDEVRQGAASIGAPCRTDGGQERRLAAQPCAGAVQRQRGLSRWTAQSAGGCADRRTAVTACARAARATRGG